MDIVGCVAGAFIVLGLVLVLAPQRVAESDAGYNEPDRNQQSHERLTNHYNLLLHSTVQKTYVRRL